MADCKYKQTERFWLYIMVLFLLFFGPCTKLFEHRETGDKIEEVKQIVLNIERTIKNPKATSVGGNGHATD